MPPPAARPTNRSTDRHNVASRSRCKSAVAALLMLLVACGSDSTAATNRVAPPTEVEAPRGISADGSELNLEVVDTVDGIALITDHLGFVVYGNNQEQPEALVCVEPECTAVWIPLMPNGGSISDRLDADEFVVIDRPDGTEQVTYAGVALYRWSGDRSVGVAGGAGVAGVWFALTEDGTPVG